MQQKNIRNDCCRLCTSEQNRAQVGLVVENLHKEGEKMTKGNIKEIIDIGRRFGFSDGFLVGSIVAAIISNAIWFVSINIG